MWRGDAPAGAGRPRDDACRGPRGSRVVLGGLLLGQRRRGKDGPPRGSRCLDSRYGRRRSDDAVRRARVGSRLDACSGRRTGCVEPLHREHFVGAGQAGGEGGEQEGRAEGIHCRGGELRSGHLLERHEKEDPVNVRGVGLGLRWEFLDELVEATQAGPLPIDFLEVSPENYLGRGGRYPAALAWLAERYPIVTHGLTMSIGGVDPLDHAYLGELARFLREIETPWHSDHLCFGSVGGRMLHDLLPLEFKKTTAERVAERIRRARDAIGMPLAIENVSYYWQPGRAEMGEPEMLTRVCEAADCRLLLDVNNAYVNATNFGLDLGQWMRQAPLERVVQIHVAGHEWFSIDEEGALGGVAAPRAPGALIVDTHGADVPDPVLAALGAALERTGPVPVVLERDQNVPSLGALLAEMTRIRAIWQRSEKHAASA